MRTYFDMLACLRRMEAAGFSRPQAEVLTEEYAKVVREHLALRSGGRERAERQQLEFFDPVAFRARMDGVGFTEAQIEAVLESMMETLQFRRAQVLAGVEFLDPIRVRM